MRKHILKKEVKIPVYLLKKQKDETPKSGAQAQTKYVNGVDFRVVSWEEYVKENNLEEE